jgi:sigma-B regulation protein RsbU (phosphoserine phosphatase)
LNHRLFSSLGELRDVVFLILLVTGIVFLLIEAASLVTGIILTRTITRAVDDLYRATRYVQSGDLTHRIRIQRNDQLGVLAESFDSMISSIGTLIEEQRQRQRLENELSIAREVQAQLFPRVLPVIPGIQLQAICRPARVVSGDYYDFLQLGPTSLGIAIADISGKGISAALLMASLQAALRSQVLLDGHGPESTADLVARMNRHLFLNTSDDRYATFFYAEYDAATHTLRYTNAGHHPPLYIVGERVMRLEEGGMVVGLFDDCTYEQGTLRVEPGSLLLAYSDGLIEPENVYGEEFSTERLIEVALRHRDAPPRTLAEKLVAATEEWAGSPEQADDMTVIVARLG